MIPPKNLLSLTLPILSFGLNANALDIDVASPDSLRAVAKTLAGGLIARYEKFNSGEDRADGLFSSSGHPYFWGQSGYTWNALISYAHLTGDEQYNDNIVRALEWQAGDYKAFMPENQTRSLGSDDQANWGLAALTAAETGLKNPQNFTWLDTAKMVFDTQAMRWDDKSCGGGLKWQILSFNNGYHYKNSFSNGEFFLLAARLAQVTGNTNKTYIEWAEKSYRWANDIGLVRDYAVFDGTDDKTNCTSINRVQWSANHGVYTEGAAILYNLTSGSQTWKDAVTGFLKSGSLFRDNQTSVLVETTCERSRRCNIDQRSFKGIAARSLARTALYAPFAADEVRKTLEATAKAASSGCSGEGDGLKCAQNWFGATADVKSVMDDGLGEAFNALEVVQGLLYPEAKLAAGNGTSSPSPTGSGSPAPMLGTGAAPRKAAGWGGVTVAGMVAVSWLL